MYLTARRIMTVTRPRPARPVNAGDPAAYFNVRNVPAELLKRAQELAEKHDRPLSQVIRELLREWVKEQENPSPTK